MHRPWFYPSSNIYIYYLSPNSRKLTGTKPQVFKELTPKPGFGGAHL
jgi:hypothetical protein